MSASKSNPSRWAPLLLALCLAACGGGGGGGGDSPTPASTGVQASGTVVTGVASKGPLNGSTVCAFAVVNNTQGPAIGTCATNTVNGEYSIDIGTYTGLVLLEATRGSYKDEATGATVPLAWPLRSVVSTATGSSVSAAITPLTELAFQDANSITAGLTSARVQAAIARVQTSFGVADIVNTQPVDALNVPAGAAADRKTYALALATFSQFQKEQATGTSLGEALQVIRNCLADSSRCGTGATNVGRLLADAMNKFQAGNAGLAGTTLNVGTIGAEASPTCSSPQVLQGGVCVTPAPTCPAPQILQNGACVSSSTSTFAEQPFALWEERPTTVTSPPGYIYDLRLCGPDCQDITTVTLQNSFYTGLLSNVQLASFRRPWNGNANVTAAAKNQVSRELNAMLTSLWAQLARPDKETVIQAIKRGFQFATTPGEVTARAAASLAAQGFPTGYTDSGTGGAGGTGGTGGAGECTTKAYTGDISDSQVYIFDYTAQIDQCLYRATGNANYITDGDRQCAMANGYIVQFGSTFRPQYCAGTKLIR
jgi:hypothetical protein